tara:strand:- start:1536 stop:2237 length:702 start_codon:yes stop_codon:yes gene_type:complete
MTAAAVNAGAGPLDSLLSAATTHVFDVDHTLTRHSTGRRFAQSGIRRGVFRLHQFLTMPWFYLRYRMGSLRLQDITREIRPITGMARSDLVALAHEAWHDFVQDDLIPGAREHVAACRSRGHRTVLLSTSFDVILEPLARELEVDAVISSELEFTDGHATGWIVGGPCYAEEKSRRLRAYLDREQLVAERSAFYSDSFHDLPTFAMVAHPVPVYPDAVLSVHARREGWPVVRW